MKPHITAMTVRNALTGIKRRWVIYTPGRYFLVADTPAEVYRLWFRTEWATITKHEPGHIAGIVSDRNVT